MKKLFFAIAFLSASLAYAQITPNGNSGSSTTSYTNGAPNDPIYIWCGNTLGAMNGSLTATPTSGTGPYTFNWFYHNQSTSSWEPYFSETGSTSTISGLASDGYRVEIKDAGNTVTDCFIAWVWNLNTEMTSTSSSLSGCNNASLSGVVNTTGTFSYYNPPPPESLITPSTQIQVCFDATHTFVSDLGFYLVGPAGCGNPVVSLMPHPELINPSNGCCCNSGNNVSNLCFTTNLVGNINPCAASTPLTGTYSGYSSSYGDNVTINWSPLYGCNAAEGGWKVQIYDCIGADVGSLTGATVTFSNLASLCGSPTSISYSSGAINSAINDNSCSAGTASIFQVPVSNILNTPITITATTTLQWTSPTASISNPTSANASAPGLPDGVTDFTLTATTSYADAICTNSGNTSVNVIHPVVDAGADLAVCNNENVTLSGSGAQSYTWDNGVTNGVPFSVSATTTYTVVGTAANGCTDTDQVTVTVGTPPTISAGSDQAVCSGQSVTLNGTGGVSYAWDNGVNNGSPFTPSATTTYTVTGTDADGCTNTDQVVVTVHTLPSVNAGTDQSVCPSTPVTLNGSGATSYSWDNGVTNGTPFTPASTTTYTVTGTDANGCVNTDQVTVTVNPLPNVNAGVDQSVCSGGSVTLNGSGATSYVWTNSVTNGTPFTPGSTATYTVTGTDANGCVNTDQVTVTVNPLPTIGAGTDQNICVGTPVTLSGSGGVSYVWSNGVTNGTAFTPGLGTVTYTVTGTDANGCQNTAQVTVVVVPVPVSDVNSTSVLSGYPGLSVTFGNASQNATSYTIDFGDGHTGSSTNVSDTYTNVYNAPGLYNVVLTASNGICQDTSEMYVFVIPFEPLGVEIPNVFTPDGDGINDEFYIDVTNGTEINVMIVNRWQNKMFEINDFTTHWDGKVNGNEASEGTYFFTYTIKGKDGSTQTGQGFVELFRKK